MRERDGYWGIHPKNSPCDSNWTAGFWAYIISAAIENVLNVSISWHPIISYPFSNMAACVHPFCSQQMLYEPISHWETTVLVCPWNSCKKTRLESSRWKISALLKIHQWQPKTSPWVRPVTFQVVLICHTMHSFVSLVLWPPIRWRFWVFHRKSNLQ